MKRKKIWLLILVTAMAAIAFGYYELKKAQEEFLESKYVHETTGTVVGKENFRAEDGNQFYVNGYGDKIKMQPGEQQKRVYYSIDQFDHLGEPRQSRVIEAEKGRIKEFGPRFTYAVPWYDEIKAGDKLEVSYRAFRNGSIQVWGVNRPKETTH